MGEWTKRMNIVLKLYHGGSTTLTKWLAKTIKFKLEVPKFCKRDDQTEVGAKILKTWREWTMALTEDVVKGQ